MASAEAGKALRPSATPVRGAASMAAIAAAGAPRTRRPRWNGVTASMARMSGKVAAYPPQQTPMAASAASGARATCSADRPAGGAAGGAGEGGMETMPDGGAPGSPAPSRGVMRAGMGRLLAGPRSDTGPGA